MVNVNKLRGKIVECGMNIESLAEKTGMSRDTLYRRISKGGIDFTINEADRIAKALSLTATELNEIFFAQYVAQNAKYKNKGRKKWVIHRWFNPQTQLFPDIPRYTVGFPLWHLISCRTFCNTEAPALPTHNCGKKACKQKFYNTYNLHTVVSFVLREPLSIPDLPF